MPVFMEKGKRDGALGKGGGQQQGMGKRALRASAWRCAPFEEAVESSRLCGYTLKENETDEPVQKV